MQYLGYQAAIVMTTTTAGYLLLYNASVQYLCFAFSPPKPSENSAHHQSEDKAECRACLPFPALALLCTVTDVVLLTLNID